MLKKLFKILNNQNREKENNMIKVGDKEYKVGVGVITTGKRELPSYDMESEDLSDGESFHLEVFNDKDRKGAAYGRNSLIKYFYDNDFDFWVVFDDDVFVTQPSHTHFLKEMIRVAVKGEWDWFASPEYFRDHIVASHQDGEVLQWQEAGYIQWLFMSKKVVDVAGYIPHLKNAYGFEDTLYSYQLQKKSKEGKLNNGVGGNVCPAKMLAYLHPTDMFGDNTTPFNNMTQEQKKEHADGNWLEFIEKKNIIESTDFYQDFEGV